MYFKLLVIKKDETENKESRRRRAIKSKRDQQRKIGERKEIHERGDMRA